MRTFVVTVLLTCIVAMCCIAYRAATKADAAQPVATKECKCGADCPGPTCPCGCNMKK
jgi:hypothetical protein